MTRNYSFTFFSGFCMCYECIQKYRKQDIELKDILRLNDIIEYNSSVSESMKRDGLNKFVEMSDEDLQLYILSIKMERL